jgi:hydrogenase nickel incorporation protein HypB
LKSKIVVRLARKIVGNNEKIAAENRRILAKRGIIMVNVMGSPGGGKTELIRAVLKTIDNPERWAVIEGDIASTIDAERLSETGSAIVQMNTGGSCHLSAAMVRDCLGELALDALDVIIVENVGNLVCPASFDLGENKRLVVTAVTEGPEKPTKYPGMYVAAQAIAIAKCDLAKAVKVSPRELARRAREVNPAIEVMYTSALKGKGVREVAEWITRSA